MGKGEKSGKYNVGNPTKQIEVYLDEASKYELGQIGYDFRQIMKMRPVFAFDYISLDKDDKCFNCPQLEVDDYIGLIEGLKKVSEFTYEKLHHIPAFRFHKVDLDAKNVSINKKDFKAKLTHKEDALDDNELPNLWQFDLQFVAKARVAGFLYKGIFYLVWYDRNHLIYPGQ